MAAAIERIKTVKVYPLHPEKGWEAPKWLDLTPLAQNTTPLEWEGILVIGKNLQKW